jgi:hypothetical protein
MPVAAPFEPLEGEVYPNAKRTAARIVEALTRYDVDADPAALMAAAGPTVVDFDAAATLVALSPLLHPERQSLGVVLNGQLGGLDPAPETGKVPIRGSVLVVVDQFSSGPEPESADDLRRVRRCIDVRLRVVGGEWRWEALGDVGGLPVERPRRLPEVAARVLEHPDIDLPHSAQWDIHADVIDEELLEVMLVMADRAPYRVTCLRSGHPDTVFATPLPSNHALGRAVDVWSVGGEPVILQSARALGLTDSAQTAAHAMTEHILDETEIGELGGPWDLDGPATSDRPRTRSFTNTVHADHLHVAFDD